MSNFNRSSSYGDSRGGERSFGGRNSGGRPSGGRGGFGGSSRGGSDRRTMHEAICGDCGNTCRVPFMPTGDRPVYCSDCFEKHGNGNDEPRGNFRGNTRSNFSESRPQERRSFSPSRDTGANDEKLDMINEKLDKILKALSFSKPSKAKDETEEIVKEVKKAKKTKAAKEVSEDVTEDVVVDQAPDAVLE